MKRDKDLIKDMMILVEENESGAIFITPESLPAHNISKEILVNHGKILMEAGLLTGSLRKDGIVVTGITWQGYEFLDNSRNSKIWNATKKAAGDLSWGVFFNTLTAVATDYAKRLLETE
jgi:hypothetical protein